MALLRYDLGVAGGGLKTNICSINPPGFAKRPAWAKLWEYRRLFLWKFLDPRIGESNACCQTQLGGFQARRRLNSIALTGLQKCAYESFQDVESVQLNSQKMGDQD